MTLDRRALLRALAIAPLVGVASVHAQDPRAGVVANAARGWLETVDRADVAASHARAGTKFRKAVSDKEWTVLYETERKPRGGVTQRALYQTTFSTRLPGSTVESEFASLVFRTSFAGQPDARETVTLEREGDGVWRVVGYFIR
jgi:Protein of unknown function (DUF4019)